MKKLLYILGSTLLKRVLLPPAGSQQPFQGQIYPKFNLPYLTDLAKRYALISGISLVFTLFFVAGTSISIFSVAQSFDLFGLFVPGAVFYTGLGMALVSIVAVVSCYYSLRNTKIVKEQIYLVEEEEGPVIHSPAEYLTLAQPFLHGFMSGWRKERDKKYYAQAQNELFPPDDELGRVDRGNVSNIRAI